jgi:hypothetical protein
MGEYFDHDAKLGHGLLVQVEHVMMSCVMDGG